MECNGLWYPVVEAITSVLAHRWVWWVLLVITVFVLVDATDAVWTRIWRGKK